MAEWFVVIFADAPTLETPRLVLRPWRAADIPLFAAINSDPVVMEHFVEPLGPRETDALVQRIQERFVANGYGLWAVEIVGGAPFVGFVGLSPATFPAHFTPAVEIGWRLAREHWGHGYATEAARAAVQAGFRAYGLPEIVSFTAVTNVRSQRVMTRLGMTHDPADDFDHPLVPAGHRLKPHVLYRLGADAEL